MATPVDEFVFPEVAGFDMLIGMFPATLVGYEKPIRSDFKDDNGEHPLSMKLIWRMDDHPDREQWSFINPERRGAKSNFYKVYKALTGQELKRETPVAMSQLVGRRAQLIMTESEKNPGRSAVTNYAPIRAAQPRPQPRPQAPPADDDDAFGDVPF